VFAFDALYDGWLLSQALIISGTISNKETLLNSIVQAPKDSIHKARGACAGRHSIASLETLETGKVPQGLAIIGPDAPSCHNCTAKIHRS